ncbi:MAG: 30S ribosomal protein S6 [Candidatus Babeliales bacterium]|jgi:small subunit ribosomal protein S6
MLHKYETLLLARTEITNDELATIERYLDKHLADNGGKVVVFDKWGKLRLAYPIDGSEYGIYILARYDVPVEKVTAVLKEIETFFKLKCSDFILRTLSVRLPANAATTYQRPDSVEMGRNVTGDTFLKDNKMDLLSSVKNVGDRDFDGNGDENGEG